jgi:hypothetical protein
MLVKAELEGKNSLKRNNLAMPGGLFGGFFGGTACQSSKDRQL